LGCGFLRVNRPVHLPGHPEFQSSPIARYLTAIVGADRLEQLALVIRRGLGPAEHEHEC